MYEAFLDEVHLFDRPFPFLRFCFHLFGLSHTQPLSVGLYHPVFPV